MAIRESLKRADGKQKLVLMLKADAYGHGLEEVANATKDIVDGFGVVSLEEGLKTRKIACKTPILVNVVHPCELKTAFGYGLTVGLSNDLQLAEILRLANSGEVEKGKIKVHLKVDSGMHRLGFEPFQVERVTRSLVENGIVPSGVYSHFGDHPYRQIDDFSTACDVVKKYCKNAVCHIASSHTLENPEFAFDGVRVGLAAYLCAMRVESTIIASRTVEKGEYVGYGDYKTDRRTNIAVVFGGYADGIDRERFTSVERDGKRYKVIGVCMDTTIVDTDDDVLKIGDEVTLVCKENLPEKAKEMGTVPYTLMTAWRGRIEKIYS